MQTHKPDWSIRQGTQVMLVTGMHRSGTSMLTRILNLMGVELGEHLVPPLPQNNETGFWEHAQLVELHEQLLEHFATSHLGVIDLPEDYLDSPVTRHYQQKLWGILRRDFAHAPCWGVKDPRISRLVPLWQDTLAQLGAEPVWVISVRHPAEVAASLVKRNGITHERALMLWLNYNLDVELHTRGKKRIFLYYPDVMADWKGCLRRISRFTGFQWPRSYEEAAPEVALFLRPELKHHQENSMAGVPAGMARAFHVLHEAARSSGGEVDTTALDIIRREFAALGAPLQEEVDRLRTVNTAQAKDIEDLQRHMNILFCSLSWRITKPVRAAKKTAKWLMGSKTA